MCHRLEDLVVRLVVARTDGRRKGEVGSLKAQTDQSEGSRKRPVLQSTSPPSLTTSSDNTFSITMYDVKRDRAGSSKPIYAQYFLSRPGPGKEISSVSQPHSQSRHSKASEDVTHASQSNKLIHQVGQQAPRASHCCSPRGFCFLQSKAGVLSGSNSP